MREVNLPDFDIIYNENKAALIDPDSKVCLRVSRRLAENLTKPDVQEKVFSVWKQQAEIQKKIEERREVINTVYLMVTRQCNLNCDFCAIYANKDLDLNGEMEISTIKDKLIPFLKKNCPHKLIVTGGEPLMKKNILRIIQVLKEGIGCPITLQSNGLIIDEEIVEGLKGNIKEIDFSTKHMFNDFEKQVALKKHIKMCQEACIQVVLSYVYERTNKQDLMKVIDIAAEYNTGLVLNVVAPIGRAKNYSSLLSEVERIEMYLDITKYIYKMHYTDKLLFNVTQQILQVRKTCGAYGKVLAIFPEGNIYVCPCLEREEYRVGNIFKDSPEDILANWNGLLEMDYIKQSFCVDYKNICNQCNYKYLCIGKCGAFFGKDDFTCYMTKGLIDYQLFYKNSNQTKEEILKGYISYLEEIKDKCISK